MSATQTPSLLLKQAERHLADRDWQQMHAICLQVLKTTPENAHAWFLLGLLTFEHENWFKAKELFEKARRFAPGNATYTVHLSKTLAALGRNDDALAMAEAASTENPEAALTMDTIGVVYSRAGFHEKAVALFEKAVLQEPDNASFQYNLGSSLQFSGKFDAAKTAYATVIDLDPDNHGAYSAIVRLTKQTPENNYLPQLERLFNTFKQEAEHRLHLGHALAKTYEDLGEYETSLHWLQQAKEIKKSEEHYKHSLMENIFVAATQTSQQNISHKPAPGFETSEPIFIIGMPRTGTTLVDRIISSHSRVQSAGELAQFGKAVKKFSTSTTQLMLDVEALTSIPDQDMSALGKEYLESTRPLTGTNAHFTDKMPLNFFYAGLIARALPNAKIICLRRNAMDTCLSNYRQLFRSSNVYYSYSYDLTDTARFYQMYDILITHWAKTIPQHQFMEVHYEDIVADQENQTRTLLEFCALPWEEACLSFHQNTAPVATASSVQVRQPLYSSSIGRWKKYGDGLSVLKQTLAP